MFAPCDEQDLWWYRWVSFCAHSLWWESNLIGASYQLQTQAASSVRRLNASERPLVRVSAMQFVACIMRHAQPAYLAHYMSGLLKKSMTNTRRLFVPALLICVGIHIALPDSVHELDQSTAPHWTIIADIHKCTHRCARFGE